ncbi:glycerophosphodiester phosphodiesterase [Glaciihabitans arcticus]|uniref:Glycerophosphodiester phosphodiesterase n=1 Tax=Glaciihabitans arcticus TaxID=2668039 RepID=A0A4Q9GTX2_9MICO|nr:glycerophosphodiester phosphodiesterase family protein [Glaciihabitans arcticus]TBN56597.1 glycerophosphodiester phosphodiesterase [Glaciihabitans arcticus]
MPQRYFDLATPRVLAHRGLALEAPENTLLSFAAALGLGIEFIETDVHASSDGFAVVSHDSELRRVADRAGVVADFPMAQLRKVDLGESQGFCSLAEALDTFPETRFNIDVKSADAIEPTARAVREANAIGRVLITSFNERRRRETVRLLPGVATSASAPIFASALLAAKAGATPLLRRILRDIDALQVPERALGLAVTTERMIRLFHSAGVEVHIWTINDPLAMHRLLDLGVDGIVTDRADLALAVLSERRG